MPKRDVEGAMRDLFSLPYMGAVKEKVLSSMMSAYPKFKDEMSKTPGRALEDMAAYEKENPLGSALGFMGNVVAGKAARGFKKAETLGRVFGGAVDELPRFEIADNAAKLKPLDQWYEQARTPSHMEVKGKLGLGQAFEHEDLFKQYPDLAYTQLEVDPKMVSAQGQYDPHANKITLSENIMNDLEGRKSTLLHEIQHAIQEKEGFSRGGNIEEFASEGSGNMMSLYKELFDPNISSQRKKEVRLLIDQAKKGAVDKYRNLAGEVESRNVQGRMNMTDAERQANPFNNTFDVPVESQIKRMKSKMYLEQLFEDLNRLKS